MKPEKISAKQVFDKWAMDYHAVGMEQSHWKSVQQAFQMIPESNGNYLEIGCGNGYGIHFMATHQYANGHCYGLDISPRMIDKARERLAHLQNSYLASGDFLRWQPSGNVRFSCVFSMEVFYYFQDIQKGVDHAVSLLNPGGLLMVLVNYYQENKESHSWPNDLGTPMTMWSEQDYFKGFNSAGLGSVKQCRLDGGEGLGTLCTTGIRDKGKRNKK